MRILLLDAAFSCMPIYEYLTGLGYDTWVIGNRGTDVLARKAGKYWINGDYKDTNKVKEYLKELSIDFIIPGCTDISLATYNTIISENEGNICFSQSNDKILNKLEFRKLCENLSIPAPRLIHKNDFPLKGDFICKPVDSYSGKGISVFDGTDIVAIEDAYFKAKSESICNLVVFETYENGCLFSCSAFIDQGKVNDRFYVREGSSVNPYAVDTSYVDFNFPTDIGQSVEQNINKIVKSLNLSDGLIHTQFILRGDQIYFIEMTRRCPGDLYSLLIELSTGYPYAAKYASYFIKKSIKSKSTKSKYILRHTISTSLNSIYEGVKFNQSMNVRAIYPLAAMANELKLNSTNRVGVIFFETENAKVLETQYNALLQRTCY